MVGQKNEVVGPKEDERVRRLWNEDVGTAARSLVNRVLHAPIGANGGLGESGRTAKPEIVFCSSGGRS